MPVDDILANSPVVFSDDSREGETTLKADFTLNVPFFQKFQAGGNFKIFGVRYDSAAPLGTDNPFSAVPEQNAFAIQQSFTTFQSGAYLQATRPVTSRLSLTVGGRLDHYAYLDTVRVSPRLAGNYQLGSRWSLRGAYGRYYQQPFLLFVSVFPENRDLTPCLRHRR